MEFEYTLRPTFNPANAPVWHPTIVADLAEVLTRPDVQWSDLEELLLDYPLESQYVRLLRHTHGRHVLPGFFFGQAPSTNFVLDEDARQILLFRILPYATLLDDKLTPYQQVIQIGDAGIDAGSFCKWVQQFDLIYAQAARTAWQAWEDHHRLLRGAERTPEPVGHLLRSASEAQTDTKTLLQACETPETAPRPAKPGLLQRLLRRKH